MLRLCAFADEYNTSLDKQIEGLKKHGIRLIEFRTVDGKNVADLDDEEAKACYEKLHSNGISVWSVGSPLGKTDIHTDFEEYEKKIRRVCRTAVILKADKIRMFSYFNAYSEREEVMKRLQKMVEIGKEYGVKMYHENEKDIYGDSVDRVKDIMDSVDGLCHIYDPANFIQCGEDSAEAIEKLLSRENYFHIKDVVKKTEEIVPAGYGDGKIDVILKSIKDRDTVLTLEPHLTLFTGYRAIDSTEMKHKFSFDRTEEAFDFAVKSLKELLEKCGYKEGGEGYLPE